MSKDISRNTFKPPAKEHGSGGRWAFIKEELPTENTFKTRDGPFTNREYTRDSAGFSRESRPPASFFQRRKSSPPKRPIIFDLEKMKNAFPPLNKE